jgi:hypothetical protein
MNLNFLSNSIISFVLGEDDFTLEFISAPHNLVAEKTDTKLTLNVRKDITADVMSNDKSFVLNLHKTLSYTVSFAIKFFGASFTKISDKKLKVNDKYILEIDFGTFNFNNNGTVLIKVSGNDAKLKLNTEGQEEEIKSLSFDALTSPSGLPTIGFGVREPEFAIGTFDYFNSSGDIDTTQDTVFKYPRLIRNGVPIISTVPSEFNTTDYSISDQNNYLLGKGEISRTIYFKIVCSSAIENINVGVISKCQLKIYLPNGLDTVKSAVYVPMTMRYYSAPKNIAIYSAEYTFYSSGIHNKIEYVDGYMYFDVYAPVSVQRDIPLQFNFLT